MSYVEKCNSFMEYVEQQVTNMLDELNAGNDYSEQYDIVVMVNERALRIPMNADSQERLAKFVEAEILESIDLGQSRREKELLELIEEHQDTSTRLEDCLDTIQKGNDLDDTQLAFVKSILPDFK